MNTIEATANTIIQNAILSSVYIDDKIVEPFSEKTEQNEQYYSISKGLFDSFRTAKKTVDFYQYQKNKDWREDVDYIFKNRDLLILDWQLDNTQTMKQTETLRILKKAVQTDNLHFVSIYTDTENLDEIMYSIKAYFDNSFNNDSLNACKALMEEIEANEGIDALKLFKPYDQSFFDLGLAVVDVKQQRIKELKKSIQEALGQNGYRTFSNSLRKINPDINKACDVLGYYVHEEPLIDEPDYPTEIRTDYAEDKFIVVNHTIIQITNKNNPEPKDLFEFFTKAVQKVAGNLLTLISLEVRGLLRESSGFVGKDADLIKDEILFHQLEKKDSFFDFLMSIIKSHTVSYFDYRQGKLKSVTKDFWESYKKEKALDEPIELFNKDDAQVINEIKKLNVYYNILHIGKHPYSKLRFGDIFYTIEANGKRSGRFFLCITAHCDCLNPRDNIKNSFFFITGNTGDINKLVHDGDGVFCSYIKDENDISAISWNPRPIIIIIPDSAINDGKLLGKDGLGNDYTLFYHSTLKENYAQRMANNSFAHAMRVGIDFAKIK